MGVRQMLFSEIYGSYFNVVAAVLSEAAENTLTTGKLTAIVQEKAFAESVLSIPAALQSGAWPLLDSGYHTVLRGKPTMPLTTLQKRWLKALLSDPRIALFDPDMRGLEDVEPLCRFFRHLHQFVQRQYLRLRVDISTYHQGKYQGTKDQKARTLCWHHQYP